MAQKLISEPVQIAIGTGEVKLAGDLLLPEDTAALVLLVSGDQTQRSGARQHALVEILNEAQLATLALDLLTPQEEAVDQRTGHLRSDIDFLRSRLIAVVDWLWGQRELRPLRIGLFGTSTGAAAALATAAARPAVVGAVVSRGGRPDLVNSTLSAVKAPTLLIVGDLDVQILDLNRHAARLLRTDHRLEIVPRASHLFAEASCFEQATHLARDWFVEHLVPRQVGEE